MLKASAAPHLRETERPFTAAGGVLLCIIPLTVFSCLYYGLRPALLVLSGMLTAIVVELLCCMVSHKRPTLSDGTAAVSGALIGAAMSPLTPYWVPMMGAAFAIGVAKMPFGGVGRNIFNPAACGLAFCAICFPSRLFTYPDPSQPAPLPLWDTAEVITAKSPVAQLAEGGQTTYRWLNLMTGSFPGPIASAGVLIVLAVALYLFVRRSGSPLITLPYLAVCAAGAAWFPRADVTPSTSVALEMTTGLLLFCGVFLLNDPVTAPRYWLARLCYGSLAGVLVLLLRHFGRFECCDFFAVLLMNSFSPLLDRTCWRIAHALRRRKEVRTA